MAEYIDREKIREEVCKDCTRRIGKDGCMAPEACENLLTALVAADPADVAPQRVIQRHGVSAGLHHRPRLPWKCVW